MPIENLRPSTGNARTHSRKQIRQIANSNERFGFTNPVLISDDHEIIAGHGRVEAAKLLGHVAVPTLRLSHLTSAQRRAYVIADNKLAQNAGWDREVLAIELNGLMEMDFDVELTGFSLAEIDLVLDEAQESSTSGSAGPGDEVPALGDAASPVTRASDVWRLGRHRLICGDSQRAATLDVLMTCERADLIFTDPPYNVPIDGHVCGLGRTRASVPERPPHQATEALNNAHKHCRLTAAVRAMAGLGPPRGGPNSTPITSSTVSSTVKQLRRTIRRFGFSAL